MAVGELTIRRAFIGETTLGDMAVGELTWDQLSGLPYLFLKHSLIIFYLTRSMHQLFSFNPKTYSTC